ncbi:hypothetical protein NX059_003098 [Plenodomus lindquistii]|nr:hypothetical protein NX059_003098 [Plenodomus lindquistii]
MGIIVPSSSTCLCYEAQNHKNISFKKLRSKMASTKPNDQAAASPLLQLPREIRDLIYEHALTGEHSTIALESAMVNSYRPAQNRDTSFYSRHGYKYQCHHARTHRRVWSVPTFDLHVAFGTQDIYNIPKHVSMTYQLGLKYHSVDRPNVNLLLTNKQIHIEASEIMYGTALFSFKGDFALATAFAFLCDRTPFALRLIKRIELSLVEGSNISGTTASHYPIVLRSTDSAVLQHAYNHYTDLCTLLSSSRISLRQLSLRVNNTSTSWRKTDSPESAEEWLGWEQKDAEPPQLYRPVWIEPLLQVQNLESICVHWASNRLLARRLADTVSVLRQEMLRKRPATFRDGEHTATETNFTFRLIDCKANTESCVSTLARRYILRQDGTWEVSKYYEEPYARDIYHRQMASDARTQGRYICYYETKFV